MRPKTIQMGVHMSIELKKRIRKMAHKKEMNLSEFMREVIKDYIDRMESNDGCD